MLVALSWTRVKKNLNSLKKIQAALTLTTQLNSLLCKTPIQKSTKMCSVCGWVSIHTRQKTPVLMQMKPREQPEPAFQHPSLSHSQHHRPQLISMVFKGAKTASRNVSPASSRRGAPSPANPLFAFSLVPFFWTNCLLFVTYKYSQWKKRSLSPFDSSDNKLLKKKCTYQEGVSLESFL